jgi:hypothetical protein
MCCKHRNTSSTPSATHGVASKIATAMRIAASHLGRCIEGRAQDERQVREAHHGAHRQRARVQRDDACVQRLRVGGMHFAGKGC